MDPPKFPRELEREIFELEAFLYPRSMVTLLVAQRVRTWIEPLLYRVLSIKHFGELTWEQLPADTTYRHSFEAMRKMILSRPAALLRDNVRHIRFPAACPPIVVDKMLRFCTGAVNVVATLAHPPTIAPLLARLPLQRLVVCWDPLLNRSCPKFIRLMHLEIRDWPQGDCWEAWSGLALLPRLTHLAFHEIDTMIPIFLGALQHCGSLKVLVMSCASQAHFYMSLRTLEKSGDDITTDLRFVMFLVEKYYHDEDWEECARGGQDFWDTAEEHVQKRRSGKINGILCLVAVGE
ncbi:hypothetical protein MVEN_01460000 [Mycena venus]|uniref:Uncharacterized protein n=1 Tax=Mycena venus TaxID=2733690 RepID=A0A8H6XVD6_9AGAR|nr:hypothetical protein MVEN_01460000 [Mycena venus]